MNKVVEIGRTTKDVEVRSTKNGVLVCTFTLAVPRNRKNDETDFIPCVAYGKTAEILKQYVRKGNRLSVYGRITTGTFQKQDGSRGYSFNVTVDEFEFLEKKENASHDLEPVEDQDLPF